VQEPFVDADDIAEIAVAALIDDRHVPGCGGHWDLGRRASTSRARLIRCSWPRH
jgi:hypothetical protein